MRTTPIITTTILLSTAALALGACGSDSDKPTTSKPAGTPAPSKAAAKPLPKFPNTIVPAGRYTTTVFKPGLELELPRGQTWRVSEPGDTRRTVALELLAGERVAINTLAVMHITAVADPKRGARTSADAVKPPADFIDWLVEHPHLKAEKPERVTVGGLAGRATTVTVDSAPKRMPDECVEASHDCVTFNFDGDEPIFHLVGDHVRYISLDAAGEQVVIEQFAAPPDQFDRVLNLMKPVLDSFKIG